MPGHSEPQPDAVEVAECLVDALEAAGCDYALGGAIALGYWGVPRGTIDVDVTLYLQPESPAQCVRLLQQIDCQIDATVARPMLAEHGYCQAEFCGRRLDVFLPLVPFYAI